MNKYGKIYQSIDEEDYRFNTFKNNLNLKSERLREEYLEKMIDTYRDIPPTEILGEFGQINSAYNDSRFIICNVISRLAHLKIL